ncbi:MAG TPA: guanylate kinase [Methylomusa anaerophila]|uniref:Guanylate kinase n=1 Tax=Methylomusa anaerophila TaxID=1930071 RepID=A0A348AFV2_9FIRM|nr:guanylate kinase [Methylomusa anaerophila]BBB89950.1 guanylate kinase [Methylomusa anaerophila]HML88323.1 guanylate kinase [Methylomusa anaerophila]
MNKVFAVLGPPCSGKTAIIKELFQYGVVEMVSHTTREMRAGEQHGVDYYFVKKEDLSKAELIERTEYFGQVYGLSKAEVLKKVSGNLVSVVAVEYNGWEQMKKLLGDRVKSIFVMVDQDTVIDRMMARGDAPESVAKRLELAKKNGEYDNWKNSDYVVKNTDSLDIAVRQVLAIMDLVVPKANTQQP